MLGYDVTLPLVVLGFSVHSLNLVSATQLGEVDGTLQNPFDDDDDDEMK